MLCHHVHAVADEGADLCNRLTPTVLLFMCNVVQASCDQHSKSWVPLLAIVTSTAGGHLAVIRFVAT